MQPKGCKLTTWVAPLRTAPMTSAGSSHLSPYYLSTIIKEATGKGALEWITLFTINMCKHYLVDTDMSVKEIADTMHFPDQSTFGRYFKHHMACSPGEYRKAAKP